jgi:uncharacterized protein YyaL (SSP411 family)
MSSNQYSKEEGYQESKKMREDALLDAFVAAIQQYILQELVIPDDGFAMSVDAAFKINRKEIAVRALRKFADQLDKPRAGR